MSDYNVFTVKPSNGPTSHDAPRAVIIGDPLDQEQSIKNQRYWK